MKEPAKPLSVSTTDEVAPDPTTYNALPQIFRHPTRQLTPKDVLGLQRSVGNRATQRLLSDNSKGHIQRQHIHDNPPEGVQLTPAGSAGIIQDLPRARERFGPRLKYPMQLYKTTLQSPSYSDLMYNEAETLAKIGEVATKEKVYPEVADHEDDDDQAEYKPEKSNTTSIPTSVSEVEIETSEGIGKTKKKGKTSQARTPQKQTSKHEEQEEHPKFGYDTVPSDSYWPFAVKLEGSWNSQRESEDKKNEKEIIEHEDKGVRNIVVTFANAGYGYTVQVEDSKGTPWKAKNLKEGEKLKSDEFSMEHTGSIKKSDQTNSKKEKSSQTPKRPQPRKVAKKFLTEDTDDTDVESENESKDNSPVVQSPEAELSQKAKKLTDHEAADAATKVISEGARWVSVRKAAQQGRLYNDTKFYPESIYMDNSKVKYVTFKHLWNSWNSDFGTRWNISEQDLIKRIEQGFSKGKLVLSQSTSNQGGPKKSVSQPNKGRLKKGKLELTQDEVNPEKTNDQDTGYGTVTYAELKQDPHTYAIPSIGNPQAHAAVREFLAGPLSTTMEKQKQLNGLAIKLNLYPPEYEEAETSEGGTTFHDTFALVNIYRDLLSTDEKKKGNAFYTLVHELGLHALTMDKSDVTKNNERALQEHNAIIDPNAVVNSNDLAPKEERSTHVKTNAERNQERREKKKKKPDATSTNTPQPKAVKPDISINFFSGTVKPAAKVLFDNDSLGQGRKMAFPTADSFLRQFVNDIKDTLSFMACNFLCSKGCEQVEINSQYETPKKLGDYVVRLSQGLLMLDQVLEFCSSCVNDHAPWTQTVKKIKQLNSTLSTQAALLKECNDMTPLQQLVAILAPELLSKSEDDGLDTAQSKEDSVKTTDSDSETGNETPTSLKQNEKTNKNPQVEGVFV